jgi:hypothetical protein
MERQKETGTERSRSGNAANLDFEEMLWAAFRPLNKPIMTCGLHRRESRPSPVSPGRRFGDSCEPANRSSPSPVPA